MRLFDVSDPAHPVALATTIQRPSRIAYAVGLTRLDDGRYLAVVWDDEQLDFYRSLSDDIVDGFAPTPSTVSVDGVEGGFQEGECGLIGCGTYHNLNFVRDCDGRLFLIGARNAQKTAPIVPGNDLASLYEVRGGADGEPPALSFVDRRVIDCSEDQCNFAAGAAVYVDDADHLFLYATSHWLDAGGSLYNFNEYSYP